MGAAYLVGEGEAEEHAVHRLHAHNEPGCQRTDDHVTRHCVILKHGSRVPVDAAGGQGGQESRKGVDE